MSQTHSPSTRSQRPTRRSLTSLAAGGAIIAAGISIGAPVHGLPGDDTTVPDPPATEPGTTTSSSTSTTTTTTTTTSVPANTSTTRPKPTTTAVGGGDTDATTAVPVDTSTTTTTTVPGAGGPAGRNITVYPQEIEYILATIRYLESRGNYDAPPNSGRASGAYQFVPSTWNNYGGYPHAYLAPPSVQDERAAKDVTRFLAMFSNDVSMVPVMWYYPIAASNPALMDQVPLPQYGNRLTIREYQTLWLKNFARISGTVIAPRDDGIVAVNAAPGIPPVLDISFDGVRGVSFPVLGPSSVEIPECTADDETENSDPVDTSVQVAAAADGTWTIVESVTDTSDAEACSLIAPAVITGTQMQPVLSMSDGVVTNVTDDPESGEPVSVTVTDVAGTSSVYTGFNTDSLFAIDAAAPPHMRLSGLARVGETVRAGQLLGFMGHIATPEGESLAQIEIRTVDVNGEPVGTFAPVVDALFAQTCTVMVGPWSAPVNGSGHIPLTIEAPASSADLAALATPTVLAAGDDADVATDAVAPTPGATVGSSLTSGWQITTDGQITATGTAAMVNPNAECDNITADVYGPGHAGATEVPESWNTPIELPTELWVAANVHSSDDPDTPLIR